MPAMKRMPARTNLSLLRCLIASVSAGGARASSQYLSRSLSLSQPVSKWPWDWERGIPWSVKVYKSDKCLAGGDIPAPHHAAPRVTPASGACDSSAPTQSIKHALACCALILLHIEGGEALADSSWIRRRCTWLCQWRSCARDSLPCRQRQPGGL